MAKTQRMQQSYQIVCLHWETLEVQAVYPSVHAEPWVMTESLKALLRTSQNYCLEAHQQLLNLRSVAFDLILSPEGPLMLEANYLWSLNNLYQIISPTWRDQDETHPAVAWLKGIYFGK